MTSSITFYDQIPATITIDRNWSCRPSQPQNRWKKPYLIQPCTVESVTEALVRGPFVAIAGVGPHCYSSEPIPLSRQIQSNQDMTVYGWRTGAERISDSAVPVIVCGIQRREGKEHIYYRLAEDISEDHTVAIGTIRALTTDQKVYVTSLKTFAAVENDMFPPVSSEEITRKRGDPVVPTVFAEQPNLINLWKQGKISVVLNKCSSATNSPSQEVESPLTKLPEGILYEIFEMCGYRELGRLSAVNKQFHRLLHDPKGKACFIWLRFHANMQARLPNVMNLGIASENLQFNSTCIKSGASLDAIKLCCLALVKANLIAQLSEDGKAIIITLPAGWSIYKLEALSQEFANKPKEEGGVPSAKIEYTNPILKAPLEAHPIKDARTIILSNTVIKGSRNKSAKEHIEHLKGNGLKGELPDALTVLTAAVLKRILTKGEMSSYGDWTDNKSTFCRTKETISNGLWSLFVSSPPSCVRVSRAASPDNFYGVGGPQKLSPLELEYGDQT